MIQPIYGQVIAVDSSQKRKYKWPTMIWNMFNIIKTAEPFFPQSDRQSLYTARDKVNQLSHWGKQYGGSPNNWK